MYTVDLMSKFQLLQKIQHIITDIHQFMDSIDLGTPKPVIIKRDDTETYTITLTITKKTEKSRPETHIPKDSSVESIPDNSSPIPIETSKSDTPTAESIEVPANPIDITVATPIKLFSDEPEAESKKKPQRKRRESVEPDTKRKPGRKRRESIIKINPSHHDHEIVLQLIHDAFLDLPYRSQENVQISIDEAVAEIPDDVEKYVFYTRDDLAHFYRTGVMFIKWGGDPIEIVDELKRHDLNAYWSGSVHDCIEVRMQAEAEEAK